MADILLPEPPVGYEYVLQEKKDVKKDLQNKVKQLKDEIKLITVPSDSDLLEIGKYYSIYYMKQFELDELKNILKSL